MFFFFQKAGVLIITFLRTFSRHFFQFASRYIRKNVFTFRLGIRRSCRFSKSECFSEHCLCKLVRLRVHMFCGEIFLAEVGLLNRNLVYSIKRTDHGPWPHIRYQDYFLSQVRIPMCNVIRLIRTLKGKLLICNNVRMYLKLKGCAHQ